MGLTILDFLEAAFDHSYFELQIYDFAKEKTVFDSVSGDDIDNIPYDIGNLEALSWEVGNCTLILNVDSKGV